MPAYNEAERLDRALPALVDAVSWRDTELLLVDDGSTDETASVAHRHLRDVPHRAVVRLGRNSGKGAAVRAGVVRARGEVIAYMDADMATDPRDLAQLVDALGESHVAVGSRALPASTVDGRPTHRAVMTRTFGMVVSSTMKLPMRDTQCGFKAFHGAVAKLLFHGCRVDRFAFDVEVLSLASRLGLRVEEVPVRWRAVAGSKVRVVQDSVRMLADVLEAHRSWAVQPPIHGVAAEWRDAEALLRANVRTVDTVVPCRGGAVALFPCVPPTAVQRITRRLRSVGGTGPLRPLHLSLDTVVQAGHEPEALTA